MTRKNLLCVANFASGTGYAWDFIESLYAGVADRLTRLGIRTWVAYPRIDEPPKPLHGSAADAIELPVSLHRPVSLVSTLRFIRSHSIGVLYFSDWPSWHPAYALFRIAGVSSIVVHDHTSGARTVPKGPKRWLKLIRRRVPGTLADRVIAVSDFVARRKIEVDMVPSERVSRMWNSVSIPDWAGHSHRRLHRVLGIGENRAIVACACRAAEEKGVDYLLRAFDKLVASAPDDDRRPVLVYMGEGPALGDLQRMRDKMGARQDIFLLGYRTDASELLCDADVCVVPSVWEEAFGLAALEPMARGVPVVASAVGGIPEVVVDGETGILVQPGDEGALADAIGRLLDDPAERVRLGNGGQKRAERLFSRQKQLDALADLLEREVRRCVRR